MRKVIKAHVDLNPDRENQLTHVGGGTLAVTAAPYEAMAAKLWSNKKANVHLDIRTTTGLRFSE